LGVYFFDLRKMRIEDLANRTDSKVTNGACERPFTFLARVLRDNEYSSKEIAEQLKRLGYDALNAYRGLVETGD